MTSSAAHEIDHLEGHVREALDAFKAGRPDALRAVKRFHPRFRNASIAKIRMAPFTMADARLVVAREHGFPSWKTIYAEAKKGKKARWNLPPQDRIDDPVFRGAVRLIDRGDERALERLLRERPALAKQRVRVEEAGPLARPTLLEFAASVPRRSKRVPAKAPALVRLVLRTARPTKRALGLAVRLAASKSPSGSPRVQPAIIDALCEAGADPRPAIRRALFEGAFDAAEALIRHGAPLDLAAACALDRASDVRRLLPKASGPKRRAAFALAAQHGRVEPLRLLLAAGVNPSRYNPKGYHAHSSPLHQAVWHGHLDAVRLLVECGASLTIKDKAYQGTPLGWARFGKQRRIIDFLEAKGAK